MGFFILTVVGGGGGAEVEPCWTGGVEGGGFDGVPDNPLVLEAWEAAGGGVGGGSGVSGVS